MWFQSPKFLFMSQIILILLTHIINGSIFNRALIGEQLKAQNLSEAVLSILKQSLPEMVTTRLPIFNLFAHSANPKHLRYFEDIMSTMLQKMNSNLTLRTAVNKPIYPDKMRHDAIILVDTAEALRFVYKDLNRFHLRAQHFYLIVLHTFRPYFYDELLEMFQLNWENGIVYANVLVHALWNSILLYTIYPYHMQHCATTAPALQNRFENQRWQRQVETFFPWRLRNLHGCTLICATWEDMPYLKIKPQQFDGIEGRLLNYFEENLNFKIKIKLMTEKQIQKSVTDEFGVFNELFESGTNFVLGAFPYRPTTVTSPYAPTNAYYMSDLYLFINGKRQPYGPYAKLIFPFYFEVWAILIFMLLLGAFVSTLALRRNHSTRSLIIGTRNKTPIYNMFIVGLGASITTPPRRNFARFLLIKWLWATLVLRAAYQALMFHYIRTDVAKAPPNSIAAVLAEKYQIHMSESVYNSIKNLIEIRTAARLFNGTELENLDKLNNSTEKIAILAPYEYYAYYWQLQTQLPNIHVIREKLFTQQLSIYMPKNSVMLNGFDRMIAHYNHYGMDQHTIKQFKQKKFDDAVEENYSVKMRLQEILGLFQLWLMGNFMGAITFIAEILYVKVKRCLKSKKNLSHRVHYLN